MKQKSPWAWVPTLYFAEGIPYVTVMTISLVLYKQLGLSNAEITFYTSWLYLPWVIKPLWSPFVDLIKTKRWWIIAMQQLIGAALGGVAFTIPTEFWLQGTLFFFWVMAFASATHDISADGFYMLGLDEHHQALFVGIRSTFYRLATIFGQGVLVMIAGNLQVIFRNSISFSWSLTFYGMTGLFIALCLWHGYILPRPKDDSRRHGIDAGSIWISLIHTIRTFFQKPYVITGLLFMIFYRMPEGLLAKVSALFLIDAPSNGGIGLSPQEYGLVQGMVCAITLPDIVYVYMSYALPSSLIIINTCVFVEQFGYGFGFTAYMLYLIYYSQGEYKTSHYAICTAFMACSMMIPGLFAGALQEAVGYRMFFNIVVASCAITFVVAWFLKIDSDFGKKHEE